LRERGLIFVGIDVIDGNLTEINVTSPTGIRAIRKVGGPDVAAMVWDAIEAKRKAR
jgi:glutathione synthase